MATKRMVEMKQTRNLQSQTENEIQRAELKLKLSLLE